MPDAGRYTPPELAKNGWDAIKRSSHSAVDAFNFGILLFEAFNNGDYTGTDQAGQTKNIPPAMQTGYKRLVNAIPKARITVGNFLEMGQRSGAFFDSPLIKLTDGIENLGVKSETERELFLEYEPVPPHHPEVACLHDTVTSAISRTTFQRISSG